MAKTDLNILHIRAKHFKALRSGLMLKLFSNQSVANQDQSTQILNDIANSFSRYAANQQTAFDSGAARSSSSNDATSMERQVQRALTQVLGRSPGRGANSFMNALNGAFPAQATSDGQQVAFTPSRSVVSLYQPGASANGTYPLMSNGAIAGNGYAGTISARQANLYRQASIIASDAQQVLNGLAPFVPEAETDQVEALRALIRSEMNALVDEFGRVDEPRKDRVLAYFSALKLHIKGFGNRAFLDNPSLAFTVDDETQTAGFELLKSYERTLRQAWDTFFNTDTLSPDSFSVSERIERANILLPVVAQVNNDLEAALDSVGFTESERRSMAARFDTLAGFGLVPQGIDTQLPAITVYDLNEWLDRFASIEGPSILSDSGQYGLDFVTDQADRLFWVLAPVVAILEADESAQILGSTMLEQVLSNERVRFAINNLLSQLNALADLSVPGSGENLLFPTA
jgi:hypothetical protein